MSNPRWRQQLESVERILGELQLTAIPTLIALNKADLVPASTIDSVLRQVAQDNTREAVAISATDSSTLSALLERAGSILARNLFAGLTDDYMREPMSRIA